jgi:preprotein translocase subunit Sec63
MGSSDRLPCGHKEFRIIHEKGQIWMVRCVTCKKPWVIMPDFSIIPVESIFTIEDLKGDADLDIAEGIQQAYDALKAKVIRAFQEDAGHG